MHYGMHILKLLADRLKSKWLLLGNVSLVHQLWEKSWSISAKVEKSSGVVMKGCPLIHQQMKTDIKDG